MATQQAKNKPYLSTIIFGMISLTFYMLLFNNETMVTESFTRGGIYTLLPVGTVFLFSFIHGAFASNLLSILGIEAKKK
jgi:hypothetical protein